MAFENQMPINQSSRRYLCTIIYLKTIKHETIPTSTSYGLWQYLPNSTNSIRITVWNLTFFVFIEACFQ